MNKIMLLLLTMCLCASCVNSSRNNIEKESSSSEIIDESTLDVVDDASPKNVVGKWNAQNKFLPEVYFSVEIYEQNNKWFAEKVFFDGSGNKEELKKNGNRYNIIDNEFHEYYVIKAGQLQLGGEHGIIEDYTITKE